MREYSVGQGIRRWLVTTRSISAEVADLSHDVVNACNMGLRVSLESRMYRFRLPAEARGRPVCAHPGCHTVARAR
jgi:hypothetical protein